MAKPLDILVSGAGVAGPSFAWWAHHFGFNVTVVEKAKALRTGGQDVDFRGSAHLSVLQRMGVLEEIRRRQTPGAALAFIDARGRVRAALSAEFTAGEVEIGRGDLSQVLFDAARAGADFRFGEQVTALAETGDGIEASFAGGAPARRFDLVVGADGLHSNIRGLALGDEAAFVRPTGYFLATFTAPNLLGLERRALVYSAPGRAVGLHTQRSDAAARAIFYFAGAEAELARQPAEVQKARLAELYAKAGWITPRLIEAMWGAMDFYLDAVATVEAPHWASGRVVLLGDAGYGGTVGGLGTGLAVVAAYVLAGELALAEGDHDAAFARYQARLDAYARRCRKGADGVGPFMAPKTRSGIAMRNAMLNLANRMPGRGLMERIAMGRADDIQLPDYQAMVAASRATRRRPTQARTR